MITLPAYRIIEKLPPVDGINRYRGQRQADDAAVLVLAADAGSASAAGLQHEYALLAEREIAGVIAPLLCTSHGGQLVLVRADGGLRPLADLIPAGGLPLTEALQLAVRIAQAVDRIHRNGLLHLALSPRALLVDASGEVFVTDFGHARRLPLADAPAMPPPADPAYMAPEQSGRTGGELGPGSDLYVLGLILYRLLTGELPFRVREALDWLHCHIARTPLAPRSYRPEIPVALEKLVLTLLAKAPEDRYRSAAGLAGDLLDCARRLETGADWDDFSAGEHDRAPSLALADRLYGRGGECQALFEAWRRAVAGRAELLLLAGGAGLGKSVLAGQLQPAVSRVGGHFVTGKFDQRNRTTPYFSLIQALSELLRQVLAEPDEHLHHWRSKLNGVLGANGRIIVETIPQASLVLGPQAPLPELPPTESRIRFQRSLHDFICAFAETERPLVIFLDDMHWGDAASLELLTHLLSDPDASHLLVIGSYRDNEVAAGHPLHLARQRLSEAGCPGSTLHLAALTAAEVTTMVGDLLAPAASADLARWLEIKTDGNPLFVRQCLLNLRDQGLLVHDGRGWTWDMASIEAADLGDDIGQLLAQRLLRLAGKTREALRIAACLGNRFSVALVAAVAGCGEDEIPGMLAEALREGLIVAVNDENTGIFRFAHDRIQQAAYALLSEAQRSELHLAAGRFLLAASEAGDGDVFEIANQFQLALDHVEDGAERRRLADVYVKAGARAKAAAAYEAARAYLATAADLAGKALREEDPALAMQLYAERAECEFLCGHAKEAEVFFAHVLEWIREPADIARLYSLRMHLYMSRGQSDRALEIGRHGLQRLGVDLPQVPGKGALLLQMLRIVAGLRRRRIEDLAHLPAIGDALPQAVMHLYMTMTVPAYFFDRDLLALLTMRMVSLSMRHGNDRSSAYAYTTFGMVLGGAFGRYREGFRFGELGRRLGEASGDPRQRGLPLAQCGIFTGAWGQPLATSLGQLRQAARDVLDCGNLMMANYTAIATVFALDGKGEALPALAAEAERQQEFVGKIGFHDSRHYFLSTLRKIACLQGDYTGKCCFSGPDYDEKEHLAVMHGMKEQTALAWHLVNRLQVAYLFGCHGAASAAADELYSMRAVSIAQMYVPRQLFYGALTELALARGTTGQRRRRHGRTAARYARHLRRLAEVNPANYQHLDLLLRAESRSTAGARAAPAFDAAIRAAAESGHQQDWALANQLTAAHFLRSGVKTAAHQYLRDACQGYRQWGADGLARHLEQRHAGKPALQTNAAEAMPIDMAAVIKASQALSGETAFPGLARRLMEVLALHAGAARAVFVIQHEDGLHIADEWRVDAAGGQCCRPVTPLAACPDIAHSVVQYAARTLSDVVIEDAGAAGAFAADAYLASSQQRSVLCLPIARHDQLLGLVYMENPLLRGAFHAERLRVLHLLAAQLAISIENVGLYESLTRASQRLEEANRDLEDKVDARTCELSDEIGERKRIEVALREATAAAEAANRAKSAFLANMSHEIRTPMNAIIGLSQLALRTELSSQQYGYLKKIDGSAELLLGLINDILDVAKIEAGKMTLEAIPFELDAIMTRVADTLEMTAHEKDLELIVHRSREIPCQLLGDPLRLSQVLLNLASNAVKFTAHGEVKLSAVRERFDEAAGEVVLRFVVSDSGIGIAPGQLGKLFQPFSQADTSITRTHGGSGLGLTIVKQLVELMGGQAAVESTPGVGSTFSFTARFGVAPSEVLSQPDFSGLRVLVVDDNDSARAALQHVLEAAGCTVAAVAGGAAALAALRDAATPYQVVFMDWNMPGMDGVEATRRIKNDLAIAQPPVVIMVTAYSREEVSSRAARQAAVVDAYLLKPVKPQLLFDTVARMLSLPLTLPAPPPAAGPLALDGAGRRILVVEDNAYNQIVARELLAGAGFAVDIAENGRLGIERVLASATPYDAVLMDVQMPVMDGWAATRELRRLAPGRDLPIIGMTAYTMPEDIERCRQAGMDDVLTKPVRLGKLLAVLHGVFQGTPPAPAELDLETGPADKTPLIDSAGALSRLGGDQDLMGRLLRDFCAREAANGEQLAGLIAAGQLEQAERLVHTAKGTAMILGLGRFTAAAGALENALRFGKRHPDAGLLARFQAELATALTACAGQLPVAMPPPAPAVHPEAPTALLEELAILLERNHMAALKLVSRLQATLPYPHQGEIVAKLRACLDGLDFAGARQQFGKLLAARQQV